MKIRLAVLLLAAASVFGFASSKAFAASYTQQINPLTSVTVTVTDSKQESGARGASTGWQTHNAKCVVKYWDMPGHTIMDYMYTVKKHWDFNVAKNKVRNVTVSTDSWINAALRAKGDWSEEYSPMDFYYSRPGNEIMDAHYTERHAKFHSIIGVKGFAIPIGTWYCNVYFRVFAKNVSGKNQNWTVDVTQKWRYLN